jgi:y4mF family transcriptional regulator
MRLHLQTPEDVGRAVRETRAARGLRQEDLALASGTGRRFIVDLEKGKPNLRLAPTLAVLQALGVHLEASAPLDAQDDDGRS